MTPGTTAIICPIGIKCKLTPAISTSKYNRPLYKWNIASLLDPCGMFEYSTNDKYIEGSLEYYFKDIVFQYKVYYRLKSIGRGCRLYYNHRTDPWRDPDESDYYPYFKDDHDVYLRD